MGLERADRSGEAHGTHTDTRVAGTGQSSLTADGFGVGQMGRDDMPNSSAPPKGTSALALRASMSKEIPSISIGGFRIEGIHLDDVQKANLQIAVPMRAGTHYLPGKVDDVKLVVPEDTTLVLSLNINRNAEGKPALHHVRARFVGEQELLQKVTIKNPSAAFEDSSWLSHIKDAIADLDIGGFTVNGKGEIELIGTAEFLGLFSKSIMPLVADQLPKLDTRLENLTSSSSTTTPSLGPAKDFDLQDLLKKLGAVIEESTFMGTLNTRPAKLVAEREGLVLAAHEAPIELALRGSFDVDPKGVARLRLEDTEDKTIRSGLLDADLSADLTLTADKENFALQGHAEVEVHNHDVEGSYTFDLGPASSNEGVDFTFGADEVILAGKTSLSYNGDKMVLSEGDIKAEIRAVTDGPTELSVQGAPLRIEEGEVIVDGHFRFGLSDNFVVDGGEFNTRVFYKEPSITMGDATFTLPDGEVRLLGRDISLEHNPYHLGERFIFDANTRYALGPYAQGEAKVSYDNGALQIAASGPGLLGGFARYSSVEGQPEKIVDPQSKAIGPSASEALKKHLATLCDAPIQKGSVTLLDTGAESFTERMKLIEGATESIHLQTYIFKDDEHGRKLSKALVKKAQSGVDVRVIVDGVGNTSAKALGKKHPIYQRLREGGVNLQIHNPLDQERIASLLKTLGPEDLEAKPFDIKGAQEFISALALGEKLTQQLQAAVITFGSLAPNDALSRLMGGLERATDSGSLAEVKDFLGAFFEMQQCWHEKILITDGEHALAGGTNLANEYFHHGQPNRNDGWRDADVLMTGPAVAGVHDIFSTNWKTMTGETMPPISPSRTSSSGERHSTDVQVIHHRPVEGKDHHPTNAMIESIKALAPGQRAYLSFGYFLPSGVLAPMKKALCDAAERGVDVRILTNSKEVSDSKVMYELQRVAFRDLVDSGARIFEVTETLLHTKASLLGDETVIVGSWNADPRSASLNAETMVITYDQTLADEAMAMMEVDMSPDHCVELKAEDLRSTSNMEELKRFLLAASVNGYW